MSKSLSQWYAEQTPAAWREQLAAAGPIETRFRAWLALSQLLPPVECALLAVELLGDPEAELRAAAARWWQRTDLETPTAALFSLLNDVDPDVRLEAAATLEAEAATAPERTAVVLALLQRDDLEPLTQVRVARLARPCVGAAAVVLPILGRWLSEGNGELREAVATTLVEWGAQTMLLHSQLTAAIEDEEPLVREAAAKTVGQWTAVAEETIAALRTAVDDEDPEVAQAAQVALAALT